MMSNDGIQEQSSLGTKPCHILTSLPQTVHLICFGCWWCRIWRLGIQWCPWHRLGNVFPVSSTLLGTEIHWPWQAFACWWLRQVRQLHRMIWVFEKQPSATTPKGKQQNDSSKLQKNFKTIHAFHPPKSVQSSRRGTGHELILSDEHLLWVEGRGFAPASSADGLHSCIRDWLNVGLMGGKLWSLSCSCQIQMFF